MTPSKKFKVRLKDPTYMMTGQEFWQSANVTMPDELILFIAAWNVIKRSPYGNTSYYNGAKDWNSFVDNGIRVSNHWNFHARGEIHCVTTRPVENEKNWYVGVYSEKTGKYTIIKTYPVLTRKKSKLVTEQLKEAKKRNIPSEDVIEAGRKFKQDIRDGKVFAIVNGEKVKVARRDFRYKVPYIQYEKDGKLVKSFEFEYVLESQ